MALRRVLPSRATPDKEPAGAAASAQSAKSAPREPRNDNRNQTPVESAKPANPFEGMALPDPVEPLVVTPAVTDSATLAAAATSAFGTLPSATQGAAPARVLEDSFVKASTQPEPVQPGAVQPEAQPEPAFVAPAWEVPAAEAAPKAIAPAPIAEAAPAPQPEPEAAPAAEPPFIAPAWDAPQPEAAAPAVSVQEAAPQPEPAPPAESPITPAVPAFTAPAWESPAEPVTMPDLTPLTPPVTEWQPEPVPAQAPAQPEAAAQPVAEPAPSETPSEAPAGATFDFQPSRPDNGPMKRRVREKRPRDFTAMGAPDAPQQDRPKPVTAFAPNVPVDTRPLDKVDEDLIATGIIAPPPADSLTSSLPTGMAESTFLPPLPEPESTPVAAATTVLNPVVLAEPEPVVNQPAPVIESAPQPVSRGELPEPFRAPAQETRSEPVTPAPIITHTPSQSSTQGPSFSLSNAPVVNISTPLPPAQSDLPWTQSQTAAEWEIESPQVPGWAPETGHDTPHAGPSVAHLPPPADLYKPLNAAPSNPMPLPVGIPQRGNPAFTPELPGQRRAKSGSMPWALIAVGALAVAGAGAYFFRSGGAQQAQQQLANLTTPSTPAATAGTEGILPPPRTENASFYSPPAPGLDTSSSSVVNFADVPPEQANQPIVATAEDDKAMPKDMSLFAQLQNEVEKARARKEAGLPADASVTTVASVTPAPGSATYTPEKLQEELAAYRNALAQSANPSALKPSTFRRDPDGYMDGKPQTTEATSTEGTPMASGALLPPPSGASAGAALPPPELYTNNPKNLPVVAEPVANAPARVRTLADFADIEPYAPEKEKVEIPKNLKPKLAATDFPSLEVLSFVPGKGIVAFADGREGVLLIGESINGWELVSVSPDNAEFKTGQKSYQVTADN